MLLPLVWVRATAKGLQCELVGSSGLNVLMAMLEQERETLCGIAQ